jgi:FdhE protein
LHAGILKFIVTNTIKPFLSQVAQQMGKEKWGGSWGKNICPVCGNRPNIGRLAKEDGKRHLRCSLCETEWLYKRLVCYNCGNEDHHTLSFLLVEEIPGYQIDVCEVCKQYLKIIDERAGFHADLQLIDVRTLYLDLIAWQQGYNNDLASSNWAHA